MALTEVALAELIRSHLAVRDTSDAGRRAWEQFWNVLKSRDDVAERAYDILEGFLDEAEEALCDPGVVPEEAKRAGKFQVHCQHAWKRIDRGRDMRPLAWAGSAGDFAPPARRVIATLVGAIARHRSALGRAGIDPTSDDRELWAVLRRVSLDPNDYHRL